MAHWKRWERSIRDVCALAEERKLTPSQDMTLEIGEPLPTSELKELERTVGPLPQDYLDALAAARSVTFCFRCSARIGDDTIIDCLGPLEAMWDTRYIQWCGHVASEFGYFEPGEDGQWITPFLHLEGDDFIAFRMDDSAARGEVFFAAHDDHESRARIAKNFVEFMDRWAALHFPDLESLLPHFLD